MDGGTDGWAHEKTDGQQSNGRAERRTDGRVEGWADGKTDGRTTGLSEGPIKRPEEWLRYGGNTSNQKDRPLANWGHGHKKRSHSSLIHKKTICGICGFDGQCPIASATPFPHFQQFYCEQQ